MPDSYLFLFFVFYSNSNTAWNADLLNIVNTIQSVLLNLDYHILNYLAPSFGHFDE